MIRRSRSSASICRSLDSVAPIDRRRIASSISWRRRNGVDAFTANQTLRDSLINSMMPSGVIKKERREGLAPSSGLPVRRPGHSPRLLFELLIITKDADDNDNQDRYSQPRAADGKNVFHVV